MGTLIAPAGWPAGELVGGTDVDVGPPLALAGVGGRGIDVFVRHGRSLSGGMGRISPNAERSPVSMATAIVARSKGPMSLADLADRLSGPRRRAATPGESRRRTASIRTRSPGGSSRAGGSDRRASAGGLWLSPTGCVSTLGTRAAVGVRCPPQDLPRSARRARGPDRRGVGGVRDGGRDIREAEVCVAGPMGEIEGALARAHGPPGQWTDSGRGLRGRGRSRLAISFGATRVGYRARRDRLGIAFRWGFVRTSIRLPRGDRRRGSG